MTFGRTASRIFPATLLGLTLASCSGPPSGSTVLTADMPLHLEEHLDVATIVGSEVAWPVDPIKPYTPENARDEATLEAGEHLT